MKKLRRVALILLVNIILLAPLIYGFEFYLERKDPKKHLPVDGMVSGKRFTWGNEVQTNRFGFRERDFQVPKPPGVFRIMVLGDSLTWGVGLAPEQRYTNLVERRLKQAYPGKNFEVLNFGVAGAPTILERDILGGYKDFVEPDLIVVGFCVNDPQPKSENYSIERERFDAKYARTFTSLNYRLGGIGLPAIAKLIRDAAYGYAEKADIIPGTAKALERTYVKSSPEWQEFVNALRDIKQMSDQMKSAPPIWAALNQSARVGSDYDHPGEFLSTIIKLTNQAEQAAREAGFKTLNYEKEIPVELANDSMAINVLDGHPSAKLNELYARKIFSAVTEELRLDSESNQITRQGH